MGLRKPRTPDYYNSQYKGYNLAHSLFQTKTDKSGKVIPTMFRIDISTIGSNTILDSEYYKAASSVKRTEGVERAQRWVDRNIPIQFNAENGNPIFPEVTDSQVVFGEIPQYRLWLKLAYDAHKDETIQPVLNKYSEKMGRIFMVGGKLSKKADVTEDEYKRGLAFVKTILGSFLPKHEDKELLAGYVAMFIAEL